MQSSSPGGARRQQPAAGEPGLWLAQAGARRKALRGMPTLVYSTGLLPLQATGGGGGPVCAICLAELEPGEHVRVLPECNHGFHVRCVDRWLVARFTCPTCRESLFAAPQKGFDRLRRHRTGAGAEPSVQASLVPLRSEGFVTPYDF